MLGKLMAAQSSLERTIAELTRAHVGTSIADTQLQRLAGLQASLGSADAASLRNLSGEISAAIAQSRSVEQQARDQVAAANAAEAGSNLDIAATNSRSVLTNAMESLRHIPVRFSSPEDERAYRDRESERAAYMAAQQAKHTPQGDLNAAGAGIGQMADAHAHGASGPEFDKQWSELVKTTEKLRAEAKANGLSTEEFDQRLRDDLRRIMKSKGYSDAQIDAQLASNRDPLEAAKGFVKDGTDVATLKATMETDSPRNAQIAASMSPQAQADAKELIASLQATGVIATDVPKTAKPHHGVLVANAPSDPSVRSV